MGIEHFKSMKLILLLNIFHFNSLKGIRTSIVNIIKVGLNHKNFLLLYGIFMK